MRHVLTVAIFHCYSPTSTLSLLLCMLLCRLSYLSPFIQEGKKIGMWSGLSSSSNLCTLILGEKGIDDGTVCYGMDNGADIYMRSWTGMIIDPHNSVHEKHIHQFKYDFFDPCLSIEYEGAYLSVECMIFIFHFFDWCL